MARIAVGGFQHETNTFAPSKATYDDFAAASAWPGLTRGEGLFAAVAGINIGIAGFVEAATAAGHDLLPLSWSQATPSAQVTEDAFERIVGQMAEDLAGMEDLDGLYLDLHGAMVADHIDDGEGEMLRRFRDVVGPDLPIVVSLDLHANVTPAMVTFADCLEIYRTYPHVDMAATGKRSAAQLEALIAGRGGRFKAFRQLPFMIPLSSGCTYEGPAKEIYREVKLLAQEPGGHRRLLRLRVLPGGLPRCRGVAGGLRADAGRGGRGRRKSLSGRGRTGVRLRAGGSVAGRGSARGQAHRRPCRQAGGPGRCPGQSRRGRQRRHHRIAACAAVGAGPRAPSSATSSTPGLPRPPTLRARGRR